MKTLPELRTLIEETIRSEEETLEPKELYEPIQYTLKNGGKRLRPICVLLGCQVFKDDIQEAVKPALGIEMFHNFTLLHDDIMDKAFIRRNQPTVHIKWDVNRAILSGDALAIKSNVYISSVRREVLPEVIDVFNTTALQVCEGQQYDLNFEIQGAVTESEYLKMISLKTAVLIAGSLKIGALVGGAEESEADLIYSFGHDMGIAFQLQDDFLDTFGKAEKFGKAIGGDIRSNKKTLLLIKAQELANPAQAKTLNKMFSTKKGNQEKKVADAIRIFKELEVDHYIRKLVCYYSYKALDTLDKIKVKPERKEELIKFTNQLINRVS